MTITSQQVDAWDAEVDAAYAAGRQEGMKQERALWELSRLGQEIEAQPERRWVGLTDDEIQECYSAAQECYSAAYKVVQGRRLEVTFAQAIEAKLKEKNT